MREIKLDEQAITNAIIESVDRFINEELGIANAVVEKTSEIKRLIIDDSRMTEKTKLDSGVSMFNGRVDVDIFGDKMTVVYTIYNFYDFDTYYDKSNLFNPKCGVSCEKGEIYISILSISGQFQENSFGDSIQHELEHLYQIKMQGKGLFQDNNLYDKAISNIDNKLYGGWTSKLANIIYYTRNEEYDAFVNGLYQQLVNLDAFWNLDDIIHASSPYKILLYLTVQKKELEDNYDNENFLDAAKFFKRPRRWFLAQCDIGMKNITKKMRKVVAKAQKDFFKVNEGVVIEHRANID